MGHEPRQYADVNAAGGGYLHDLAFAQSSQQKMFGYKRAASAILSLDTPVTELLAPNGALARIPERRSHHGAAVVRGNRCVACSTRGHSRGSHRELLAVGAIAGLVVGSRLRARRLTVGTD
jgi:hypothetical protein